MNYWYIQQQIWGMMFMSIVLMVTFVSVILMSKLIQLYALNMYSLLYVKSTWLKVLKKNGSDTHVNNPPSPQTPISQTALLCFFPEVRAPSHSYF